MTAPVTAPIVAIDAGNSRIKWGLHDGRAWLDKGILATADVAWLSDAAEEWPANSRIVLSNVAGASVGERIVTALAGRHANVVKLRASAEACGVRNAYERPEQLGADRWAALIGARGQVDGACLVICAGTATTIDWLDARGEFRGGVILPGFDLMRTSLAQNTAQLPLAEGLYCVTPRNTADAIVSGCLHAQAGAIDRMYSFIEAEPGAVCLLTGGSAAGLAPHLHPPVRLVDGLILDGLVRFATSL
jgi:type III pantothenate kinase